MQTITRLAPTIFRRLSILQSASFATLPLKKKGTHMVADVPFQQIPTRPKLPADEQDRFSKQILYDLINYRRKDRLPRCRYFSLEYNNRVYHVFNAYYYPLGRMINRIATAIRGRNSPHYRNNQADVKNGDICVVVNIEDPLLTGKKLLFKKLRYHTGFIGHLRTHDYRSVLNKKPELLYHYLLRKVMPKNYLSEKYMANVILCRGPTHSIANLPQFAPDRKVYEFLTHGDAMQYVRQAEGIKIVDQMVEGDAEKIFGRKFEKYVTEREKIVAQRSAPQKVEDISQLYEEPPLTKRVPDIRGKKLRAMKNRIKRVQNRYKQVRAPYRERQPPNPDLQYFDDEKKARASPLYPLLQNEDLEEADELQIHPDPHTWPQNQPNKPPSKK